ncbi:MAG: class C sortase [Ruminococcus sp.]|nr:class C sortase [Ruminococcus sp.]
MKNKKSVITSAEIQPKTKKKRSKAKSLIPLLIILLGACVLLYPAMGNVISYCQQMNVVAEYEKQVSEMKSKDIEIQKKLAIEYNQNLGQIVVNDPFADLESSAPSTEVTQPTEEQDPDDYFEMLTISNNNVMGFIKIPDIKLTCPIFHGTSEAQLQVGVGHLQGTSLPVGGLGSHCVITGHTGIPGNMLFTDLDKLEVGDKFYLHILDEVLAYEIDQINIVEPQDTSKLQIERDNDLCTLVTCTPYGINSHRLLVRGVRTEYVDFEDEYEAETVLTTDSDGNIISKPVDSDMINIFGILIPKWVLWVMIPVGAILIAFIIFVILRKRKRSKESSKRLIDKDEQRNQNQEENNKE